MDGTLDELAVLEAVKRALERTGRGRQFDPVIFEAIATAELVRLRAEIAQRKGG